MVWTEVLGSELGTIVSYISLGGTGFLPYRNVWTRADADTLVQVVSHTKKYFCCRENKRQTMTVHFSTEQKFA